MSRRVRHRFQGPIRSKGGRHFRDGRAPTLKAAVLQPNVNPREMDLGTQEVADLAAILHALGEPGGG